MNNKQVEEKKNWLWDYMGLDFYVEPEKSENWIACAECGLTPRIWEFDNGRYAECVCGKDRYNHKHKVSAKPIGEFVRETGGFNGYDSDELRKNWNEYIIKINKQYV